MRKEAAGKALAFIVPTLAEVAAQNEDVVQLLLVAAAWIEQSLAQRDERPPAVTLVVADRDTSGWKHFSGFFSKRGLAHVSIESMGPPDTPNLAMAGHKPAYELFEWLKAYSFDEVHCLDRGGLLFYPTQAKQLGLYFLRTVLAVHVVGGTLFRAEANDQLVDSLGMVMDDMLERGSVERADVVYVHDPKAWQAYAGTIEAEAAPRVIHDLAWPYLDRLAPAVAEGEPGQPVALIYYGSLGGDGGLPFFCDMVSRALPQIARPVELFFVGAAQAIGGMDAMSYIRLRSAKWGVPVSIKRDLAIVDEIELIASLGGVVIVNTARRAGLRARLIAGAGVALVHVDRLPGGAAPPPEGAYPAIPGQVADALVGLVSAPPSRHPRIQRDLVGLWRAGRPALPALGGIGAAPPLRLHEPLPRVTVCVTHFARPQKLRTALASLRAQTYGNFEVIVVDDGSPDPQVQRELAVIREEIAPLGWRLLVQANRYLGAARNFGARHATGEYLIFMDDDNAAKPGEISTLVAVAQRSGAQIVTTFYDAFEHDEELAAPTAALRFTPFGADPALGILTNCFGDANALYARAAFDQLGGFTEDYGITHEDWEFFCRASLEGIKLVCVPEPLFWYRVDAQGMYRGEQTLMHKSANMRRHIRPFLQKLPAYQGRLVQLTQGLASELPLITVGESTRTAAPRALRPPTLQLPYARVAVITRTKDRPLLLRRAIRSVLDQTFKDWLLIIVNDGGDPANVSIVVDELADELGDQLLVLHHPVSMGMQTAANAGLSSCESDFLIIHDDDDSWEPTFLARTVSHLDDHGWSPRLGGVVTWARVVVESLFDDGTITTHESFVFNPELHQLSLIDLAIENRFPPISFLFRRAALEVVGPFREQYGVLGDWDFHLRVLQQFDIDVIPEPLANYHHRAKGATGMYGNSVHVQTDQHRAKRAELLNDMVRGQGGAAEGISLPQLMALGEMQHAILAAQRREFQRLHDYIWTVEQRVKYVADQSAPATQQSEFQRLHDYIWTLEQRIKFISRHFDPLAEDRAALPAPPPALPRAERRSLLPNRNLVFNGDFRVWPGMRKTYRGPGGAYAYAEISPDVHLSYDGRPLELRVERRTWVEDGYQLSFGKPFVHIEHEGRAQSSSWITIEYNFPSVQLLAGRQICISAVSRLKASHLGIQVGGRYDLGADRGLVWPSQLVAVGTAMMRWNCTITCPAVQPSELSRNQRARILIGLPTEGHFEFDLTDLQIEFGVQPTEFQYRPLPWSRRIGLWWKKNKRSLKRALAMLNAVDDGLNAKKLV